MNSKKTLIAMLLSFLAGGNLYAQVGLNKLAQSTMNFQLVSTSAIASGMGEAYCAVGTGAESIFYNPAGLAEADKTFNVSFDYTEWIADINYMAGAVSWNLNNYGVVGLSVLNVDYGTINGTSLDPNPGSALGYIDNGPVTNVGAYSFGLSYAKAINTQFMVGGNVRLVGQNLGENTFSDGTFVKNDATKLAFDVGVKYITDFRGFRFGMAIRNFSSDIRREVISEQLPLTFTLGGAIDLMDFVYPDHSQNTSLILATDFLHPNNYSERVDIGLEYRLFGMIAVRGGYQTNRDIQSWSAGFGLNSTIGGNEIQVDYSFSKMTVFNNVNRISVAMSF